MICFSIYNLKTKTKTKLTLFLTAKCIFHNTFLNILTASLIKEASLLSAKFHFSIINSETLDELSSDISSEIALAH